MQRTLLIFPLLLVAGATWAVMQGHDDALVRWAAEGQREFQNALAGAQLATSRGLLCTADDRLRREVIQQLICNLRLDFEHIEQAHQIEGVRREGCGGAQGWWGGCASVFESFGSGGADADSEAVS